MKKISWTKLSLKCSKIVRKRDKESNKYKRLVYWLQYYYWIYKWEHYFE